MFVTRCSLLWQELDHTSATLAAMGAGHATLAKTAAQYGTQRERVRKSHRLLGTMRRASLLDSAALWGGVALFTLVVAYVVVRRAAYFVPAGLIPSLPNLATLTGRGGFVPDNLDDALAVGGDVFYDPMLGPDGGAGGGRLADSPGSDAYGAASWDEFAGSPGADAVHGAPGGGRYAGSPGEDVHGAGGGAEFAGGGSEHSDGQFDAYAGRGDGGWRPAREAMAEQARSSGVASEPEQAAGARGLAAPAMAPQQVGDLGADGQAAHELGVPTAAGGTRSVQSPASHPEPQAEPYAGAEAAMTGASGNVHTLHAGAEATPPGPEALLLGRAAGAAGAGEPAPPLPPSMPAQEAAPGAGGGADGHDEQELRGFEAGATAADEAAGQVPAASVGAPGMPDAAGSLVARPHDAGPQQNAEVPAAHPLDAGGALEEPAAATSAAPSTQSAVQAERDAPAGPPPAPQPVGGEQTAAEPGVGSTVGAGVLVRSESGGGAGTAGSAGAHMHDHGPDPLANPGVPAPPRPALGEPAGRPGVHGASAADGGEAENATVPYPGSEQAHPSADALRSTPAPHPDPAPDPGPDISPGAMAAGAGAGKCAADGAATCAAEHELTDAEGDPPPVKVPGAGSPAPAKAADPEEDAVNMTPTEAGGGGAAREDASLHDVSPAAGVPASDALAREHKPAGRAGWGLDEDGADGGVAVGEAQVTGKQDLASRAAVDGNEAGEDGSLAMKEAQPEAEQAPTRATVEHTVAEHGDVAAGAEDPAEVNAMAARLEPDLAPDTNVAPGAAPGVGPPEGVTRGAAELSPPHRSISAEEDLWRSDAAADEAGNAHEGTAPGGAAESEAEPDSPGGRGPAGARGHVPHPAAPKALADAPAGAHEHGHRGSDEPGEHAPGLHGAAAPEEVGGSGVEAGWEPPRAADWAPEESDAQFAAAEDIRSHDVSLVTEATGGPAAAGNVSIGSARSGDDSLFTQASGENGPVVSAPPESWLLGGSASEGLTGSVGLAESMEAGRVTNESASLGESYEERTNMADLARDEL